MYRNLRLVYITTNNEEEALKLGRKLVEERLAACINVIPAMKSVYRWEGELVEDNEAILIVKTHYSKMPELTEFVKKAHSYECPCVVSFNLSEDEGNTEYLNWLLGEVNS
jgi:periplasmic divalent cation tolerance protein